MAPFPAAIEYLGTVTTLVEDVDTLAVWPLPAGTALWREFSILAASADGSAVAFKVCDHNHGGEGCRLLLIGADGSGLQDISAIFPPDLVSTGWGWGNLRISDDGSHVFIKAQADDGTVRIVEYVVPMGTGGPAVAHTWWSSDFDRFAVSHDGARFLVGKHDEGYDPTLERSVRGLYFAEHGMPLQQYLDIHDLPCSGSCDNLNMVQQLGGSAAGDRAFFTWQSDYLANAHPDNRSATWVSELAGQAWKLTGEDHWWLWQGDWRGVSDHSGTLLLEQYRHRTGDPRNTDVVDIGTGEATRLSWTSGLNPVTAFMTRSGRFVMLSGEKGDAGALMYLTRRSLETGDERDTWSDRLPRIEREVSNVTADDRFYFVTNRYDLQRVDTRAELAGDFSKAPRIHAIAFSAPWLWHEDGVQIGITAQVSDAQGLANLSSVSLLVLVDGVEEPIWSMPREPLAFPTGDPGSTRLYDDGTHGDLVAGDGVFSFDAIATRKTDASFNTWFSHFALPHPVGIRILAKDLDGNAAIADTVLWITDENLDPQIVFLDGFEAGAR